VDKERFVSFAEHPAAEARAAAPTNPRRPA